MTQLEFYQALDRWGADLDRWPQADAARARRHLALSEDARRALDAARAVEQHLAGYRQHAAPAQLATRIAGRVVGAAGPSGGVERALDWLTARLWRPAFLALVVTAAGYLAGATAVEPVDAELADDVMSLAFNDLYAELDDAQ